MSEAPHRIRCHDFRVTFCTMCYEAGVPVKTLQAWMGHADATMIMSVYAKLTAEKEQYDASKLNAFTRLRFT
ncbi:MAG: tyrosine-type recombinase/integrase [Clostridia bacterium]|nr:tyrosine-type recombinase/integrase [Clostridia bacterium]